jgi:hypothetical protein
MKSASLKALTALVLVGLMAAPSAFAAAKGKPAPVATAASDARSRHAQALDLALAGNTKAAITALNKLVDDPKISEDDKDRAYLSIGRINYQDGFDEAALIAYGKIDKGSPAWLESLEERAWAEMRSGDPEKAIGTLKTVVSPIFKDQVRSESYFTMALAQLRVCDYPSLFKTIEKFKKTFRPKIAGWEASTDLASRAQLQEASDTIQKLNLVEAEAIQHLYLNDSGKKLSGSVPRISNTVDEMKFPDVDGDNDEVWMDEIDKNRVRVKGCPTSMSFSGDAQNTKEKAKSL